MEIALRIKTRLPVQVDPVVDSRKRRAPILKDEAYRRIWQSEDRMPLFELYPSNVKRRQTRKFLHPSTFEKASHFLDQKTRLPA